MTVFLYILLLIVPLSSGMAVLYLRSIRTEQLKLIIAFSGGFLLSVCVLHLLPEIYESGDVQGTLGIFILAGFILQILLDQLSAGVEHGHMHAHQGDRFAPYLVLTGLCIHSFLEGLPLGGHSNVHHGDEHSGNDFFYAVLLHKIPEAIALVSVFMHLQLPQKKILPLLLIYTVMTPAASLLPGIHSLESALPSYNILLALVIGLFLHLSTSILFESGTRNHGINLTRVLCIVVGMALAWLIS